MKLKKLIVYSKFINNLSDFTIDIMDNTANTTDTANTETKKKTVGDKVFTPEEIEMFQKKCTEKALNRMIGCTNNKPLLRLMQTDVENNRQDFFVLTVTNTKRGMTVRFGRTVFKPDAKYRSTLLNPNDDADKEMIEGHFQTAEKRFKKDWKKKSLNQFLLPAPVWNPNDQKVNLSLDKTDLKNNYSTLMSTPLNLYNFKWEKNQELNYEVFKNELIVRMRSQMVCHPLPTPTGTKSSAPSLNASASASAAKV